MDQLKIGKFIAQRRKDVGLTQLQLGESLGITDRAVSKWETGKAMPDTSIMLTLCDILGITVNDLLCGEVVAMEQKGEKTQQLILELARQKEEADKKLLALEILIGIFSIIILFAFVLPAAYLPMETWLRVVLVVTGFAICMVGIVYALKIEQTAGYYQCAGCGHRHVPSFSSVFWAMHMGRTRYMNCPQCGKKSWQKKVLTKD